MNRNVESVLRSDNRALTVTVINPTTSLQIELGGKSEKTKTKEGKLNPEWNETFTFTALEGDEVKLTSI